LVATRSVNTAKDTISVRDADFNNLQRISLRFEFRSPTGDLEPATLDRVMNVPLPLGGGQFAPQTLIVVMPEAKAKPSLPPSHHYPVPGDYYPVPGDYYPVPGDYYPVPGECYPVHRRCGLFRR
jgi:hypothetical protein